MKYIGCDFHPSFQQIAMLDKETGEMVERRLVHEKGGNQGSGGSPTLSHASWSGAGDFSGVKGQDERQLRAPLTAFPARCPRLRFFH
jgi:hypothetical protein